MLAVLSPSKTLDFETSSKVKKTTIPELLEDAEQLVAKLSKMSAKQLSELMGISDKLADENRSRFRQWEVPFDASNSKPAVFAFRGDVYDGLNADSFAATDLRYAQSHLRILSGLYGVLRPLDLMQAYRLEMGTKLSTRRGKDLYAFWGERITNELNVALARQKKNPVLLNLASNEYMHSVRTERLRARVVQAAFKEKKGEDYKMISFFAKKARGTLAAFVIQNKIQHVDDLKGFREDGYRYHRGLSTEDLYVFTRGK